MTQFFANCKSLNDLKAEYRRLVLKHHPDVGGDVETMKAINCEYEARFGVLKDEHNATNDEERQTTETANEYRDIILALLRMCGLIVER